MGHKDVDGFVKPQFDGQDALTWPFPESPGSPVWQAWRKAREAARQDHGRTPWAIGLQQVLASNPSKSSAQLPPEEVVPTTLGTASDATLRTSNAASPKRGGPHDRPK
jgi:hypothetical protein